MDEKTTKLIKEKFNALPDSIKEVFLSSNYEETLLEIGKQYNLNVEQLGTLEVETSLVMMGLIPTKDFETELTRELHVDKLKGSQIVKDINEKIFIKIRELLKLMNTPVGEEPFLEEIKETQNSDTQILNSAGIEIIDKKEESSTVPSSKIPPREMLVSENIGLPSISAQKLSSSFQIPAVKTQYSLDNITKTSIPASPSGPSLVNEKPKIPSIDPYREIPE